MKFTAECGCVVELPVNYVLHFIKGVEYKKAGTNLCLQSTSI